MNSLEGTRKKRMTSALFFHSSLLLLCLHINYIVDVLIKVISYRLIYFPLVFFPHKSISITNTFETFVVMNRIQSYPNLDDLEYRLNRAARRLQYSSQRTEDYVDKLIDILDRLNDFPPFVLSRKPSHQFYILLRDLLRDLFIEWHSSQTLSKEDIRLLKRIILFFDHCVDASNDVLQLKSWLIEQSFIQAFTKCLSDLDRLLANEKHKRIFKQVLHLFDVLSIFYQRLPRKTIEDDELDSLFEGTMDCLMSFNYDEIFRQFPVDAPLMRSKENFFLIKCPSLIHSYRGKTLSHCIFS